MHRQSAYTWQAAANFSHRCGLPSVMSQLSARLSHSQFEKLVQLSNSIHFCILRYKAE